MVMVGSLFSDSCSGKHFSTAGIEKYAGTVVGQ